MGVSFMNILQVEAFSFLKLSFSGGMDSETALQDRESIISVEQRTVFFIVKYNKDNASLQRAKVEQAFL